MRLIISKDGVKRGIETPFALCCSTEDLTTLALTLQQFAAGMRDSGSTYGWVRVDTDHPDDAPANTPPLPWVQL